MPSFTMELWRVIDLKPDAIPEDQFLGLDDYPLFDPDYREGLNTKIKNHFMYQEIGHETVEQFTFSMRRKMHEIMPLYNELYKTTRMEFDPLSTIDIRNTSSASQEQASSGTSESDTDSDVNTVSKNVASTFPQLALAGNKDYATSGADSNSQTTTAGKIGENTSAESSATSSSESTTKGYQGSPAQLIMAYRAALLNVDMLIINDLDELFMAVWINGDEYSRSKGRYFY